MVPLAICGTEEDGDGCGGRYAKKTSPGLCAKCRKLATLLFGSVEYELWKCYKQCAGCGIAWKNFEGGICGNCLNKENDVVLPDQNRIDSVVQHSKDLRGDAMSARLAPKPKVIGGDASHGLNTTGGLNYAKHGGGSGQTTSEKIIVCVEVRLKSTRRSSSTDPQWGSWAKPWSKDIYLSEVLDDAIGILNPQWEKAESMSLIRTEAEFRFTGNKIFLPGTASMTVGAVFKQYSNGDNTFYAPKEGKNKIKGASLALELFVDRPAFLKRLSDARGDLISEDTVPKKRRSNNDIDVTAVKKHRVTGSVALKSTFVRTAASRIQSSAATYAVVRLVYAHCVCIDATGEVDIGWPDAGEPITGLLGTEIFAQGQTKYAYNLSIGQTPYVAKRFYNIGDESMTAENNEQELRAELVRLYQGSWFWSKFREIAKLRNVDIFVDIEFADGFLIREMGEPSAAAALPPGDLDKSVWLVEPRRTKSVVKFSGTLMHPSHEDKMGMTISSYAHFVYEHSDKTLVFADIQGSPMPVRNRDGIVLFDLMTHTSTGDSGVGDHGLGGIKTFTDQHRCHYMCEQLALAPFLNEEDEEKGT